MRRVISRTRRVVRGPEYEYPERYPRYRRPSTGRGFRPTRRASGIGILVVILVIGGIAAWSFWTSRKSAEEARKTGPDAVVEQVIMALEKGSESRAKTFVKEEDTATSAQLSSLFTNYREYTSGEDYIDWSSMKYEVKTISDTEAQVEVSGTAEIIEIETTTWIDEYGQEIEETTEIYGGIYSFYGIIFGLKKVEEEWFLS